MSNLKINERDYLRVLIAKVIAEHFGTLGVEQYFEVADKIFLMISDYAARTANLKKE